jgi:hypothetical protein
MSPALGYKFPAEKAAAETHEDLPDADLPDANDAP